MLMTRARPAARAVRMLAQNSCRRVEQYCQAVSHNQLNDEEISDKMYVNQYLIFLSAKDGSKDNYSKCNRVNNYRKCIPTDTRTIHNLQDCQYQRI